MAKWQAIITETYRHVIEFDAPRSSYPHGEVRTAAHKLLTNFKAKHPKGKVELEQVYRDRPEAHLYFDDF